MNALTTLPPPKSMVTATEEGSMARAVTSTLLTPAGAAAAAGVGCVGTVMVYLVSVPNASRAVSGALMCAASAPKASPSTVRLWHRQTVYGACQNCVL